MKRNSSRLLAFILAFTLCAGTVPVQAQAAAKKPAVAKVTLNKKQYVMKKGEKLKLKATVSPAKARKGVKVRWSCGSGKIATVSSKGVVTAKARKGRAKIIARAGGKKASCTVIIGTAVQKIKASNLKLAAGKSAKIKAVISPKKASIRKLTYKSSKPKIAAVDAKGKVKAKKAGTAKITITAADRGKVKKVIKVTVTKKGQPAGKRPVVQIKQYSDQECNNVDKDRITVSGTAAGRSCAIKNVSYSLKYAAEDLDAATGTAKGTENWSIKDLPLQIGTNILTIKATDAKNRTTAKEIIFNRLSTQIRLSEDVVLFEEEKNREISNDILDYWTDGRGTDDTSDDLINLLFYEDAELVQSVKGGKIKAGDVIMLQPCEALYMGFNGIVVSHGEAADAAAYPADRYEVISFRQADFTDLFDSDISLSYEIADVENPLAFAWFPTDVQVAALNEEGQEEQVLYTSDGYEETPHASDGGNKPDESGGQEIKDAGFQKSAIPYMMNDALNMTGSVSSDKGLSIGIKFQDAVLYDKDGNGKTTNDQFKIGGKMTYENMKAFADVEWHPTILDQMPQQIIGKYTYDNKVEMHAEWTGEMELKDLVREANKALGNEFENKRQFAKLELSGVDMSNSILLGAIGIQVSLAGANPTVGIKNTQYASKLNPGSAILVIIPVLDVEGKISAKASITYDYSAYHEQGMNMQKKDFTGKYGSLKDNKGQTSIALPYNRSLEIYDICGRSKTEKNVNPKWSLTLSGEGEAMEEVALGADFGLMVCGIIPATVRGRLYESGEVKASGKAVLGNGLEVMEGAESVDQKNKVSLKTEGAIGANLRMGVKAGAYFKLKADLKSDSVELDFIDEKKEWSHDLCQITIASISGQVLDADSGEEKKPPLEGVKVTLIKDPLKGGSMGGRAKTEPVEVYTDAKGRFVFPNVKDGKYRLAFSKDGYEVFEKDFTMEGENQDFLVGLKLKNGFQEMLNNLIAKEGLFKVNQKGTMRSSDTKWFNPKGIISAAIQDFDSDGAEELLVCRTKKESAGYYRIYLEMYEAVKGSAVLADSMPFSAYQTRYDTMWSENEDIEQYCGLHAVRVNGKCYLMCEEDGEGSVYRDEMPQNYWLLQYRNDKFWYAGSLTSASGILFGFTGYEFENGSLASGDLYYGDEYGEETGQTPLYDDFAIAAAAFFGKYGISLADDVDLIRDVELGTILSDQNDKDEIFSFTNWITSEDGENEIYKFSAALKRAEMVTE